jgi:hypothetical protein
VPGTSSDHPRRDPGQPTGPAAGSSVQQKIRITNICATPWHLTDGTAGGDLPDYLKPWRFERYYRLSADQLPRVLCREALDPGALKFRRWQHPEQLTGARIWLFRR